jgi:hypothetical protein
MLIKKATMAAAAAAVVLAVASATPALGAPIPPGPVKTTPASFTPWLLQSTPNQNVQELVPCGALMYAVGTISAIGQGTSTYTRGNAFSFSQTTGAVTTWNPQVNGAVNSVALSPDCSTAYLAGTFSSVHGTAAANIVAVYTTTGAVRTSFGHTANAHADTVQYAHGAVIVGGGFTSINGTARSHLASLDPTTGIPTAYVNLSITGAYPRVSTKVYNSQLSHSGDKMLIQGVFTQVGSSARQQAAILDLGATSVTVDSWFSTEFNAACMPGWSFYVRAGAWSQDDSTIYVATTGFHPPSGPGSQPGPSQRAGLCDAVAAFPATPALVSHKWVNYTGCDSLYSVAADANDVYIGGHERWADNNLGCDYQARGAVARPGLASINPLTGVANAWNPTRSLGYGATGMVLTPAGLWIASDNWHNGGSQQCGGVSHKGGICFLPYP